MSDARFLDATDENVRADWSDLLARSHQATPFSTLEYAEAVRDVLGIDFRLAGIREGGKLTAGVLLYERRRGPYRTVVVPPITPYTTLLFSEPLRETDINQCQSPLDDLLDLLDRSYHALAFHLHPSLQDVRSFMWRGWSASPLYTHLRALHPENELTRSFSKSTRKRWEKARIDYAVQSEPDTLSVTTTLLRHSFARHDRSPPLDDEVLRGLVNRLRGGGIDVRHYVARRRTDSHAEGGQLFIADADSAYVWTGGSERGPSKTLLLVQAMLDYYESGVRSYDHVGANTPSIAEFKRSFGAPLVTYFRVTTFNRLELRWLHALRPLV